MADDRQTTEARHPLTNAGFAELAARVAQKSAHWAADSLLLSERQQKPMRRADVLRFTAEIRGVLDAMEERANG